VNEWFSPLLVVSEGKAEVRMNIRNEFHHSAGAAHGYIYFKMLDDATFFAANSVVDGFFVLTAKFEIELLKPVVAGEVRAVGEVTSQDERRIYAQGELYDCNNELIGKGKGKFARSKMALSPEVSYR